MSSWCSRYVGRPSSDSSSGAVGEGRADGVVPAGAVLLDATEGLLVTGVDRRRPGRGEQHDEGVRQVPLVGEPAGQPGDVVVAQEGERHEGVEQAVVPVQRVRQLEEVAVVEGAPDRLPQLVLGDRVQARRRARTRRSRRAAPRPRGRPRGCASRTRGRTGRPERRRDGVGGIEPPAVGAAVQPGGHDLDDVVGDGGLVVVQRDQRTVALEVRGVRLPPGSTGAARSGGTRTPSARTAPGPAPPGTPGAPGRRG